MRIETGGAPVNWRGKKGRTAFVVARERGHDGIVVLAASGGTQQAHPRRTVGARKINARPEE